MTTNTFNVSPDQTSFERELLAKLRSGDPKAQYAVYKRYVDAMYHTAIRLVNDQTDAQDVVQECFIKVFGKIDSYRGDATLGAWIKRIVINSALNCLRKRQRNPEFSADDFSVYETNDDYSGADYPMTAEQLHYAVRELPSGCRSVVSLYAFEGYSHKEIAGIMNITESTSKTQFRRGKILLKQILIDKFIQNEH